MHILLCVTYDLIAAKGGGIAQLRYQKREKAVSGKNIDKYF